MSENQVSDILAQAFAAEGVDTLFTLMGDANMYWSAAMADNQKHAGWSTPATSIAPSRWPTAMPAPPARSASPR